MRALIRSFVRFAAFSFAPVVVGMAVIGGAKRAAAQPCTPQFYGGFPALNGAVRAMTIYDDGTGPALFIGGSFTTAASGGTDVPVSRIAKWNGSNWEPVGGGVNGTVYALQVWDDGLGGGAALYVGGNFDRAGGQPANGIARWSGAGWHDLAGGVEYANLSYPTITIVGPGEVRCIALFDEGAGPLLIVGGDFDLAGHQFAQGLARWNGEAWSAVGMSNPFLGFPFKPVYALAEFSDEYGRALFVGGSFSYFHGIGGTVWCPGLARWDGNRWTQPNPTQFGTPFDLVSGAGGVYSLSVSIDSGQPTLFIGGAFGGGSVTGPQLWHLRGGQFTHMAAPIERIGGPTGMPLGGVFCLLPYNDGTGPSLAIGGEFGSNQGNRLIRFTANGQYLPVGNGSGVNGPVYLLASIQGPVPPGLYAGGSFTTIGGVGSSRLARFGCAFSDAPTQFPLVSPAHNASPTSRGPALAWAQPGSASPAYYALRVYLDAAQTQQAYAADNIPGLTHVIPENTLSPGTRYYWTVRATNINGSTLCQSPFSFATRSLGDADGNGVVDFIDLNAVLSAFGQAP